MATHLPLLLADRQGDDPAELAELLGQPGLRPVDTRVGLQLLQPLLSAYSCSNPC